MQALWMGREKTIAFYSNCAILNAAEYSFARHIYVFTSMTKPLGNARAVFLFLQVVLSYGLGECELYLLVTHLVGALGGFLGKKKGIPAGGIIGALLAVALMNTAVGHAVLYPPNLRIAVQILSGLVIGSRFSRADVKELRVMAKPVLILLAGLFALSIFFSVVMAQLSSISFITALFACAPGGMSDLALVAVEFGASTDQVMLLQLFRFVVVVVFFPTIIKKLYLSDVVPGAVAATAPIHTDHDDSPGNLPSVEANTPNWSYLGNCALSFFSAAAGACLLRLLGVPAGAIIGAILATVFLNILSEQVTYPAFIKAASRILAGCYIGSQIGRETWLTIGGLLLPMLIMVIEVFAMSFGVAYLVHRFTGMNKATALFCCTPGGIVEMGLIADELGLDTPKIVMMHSCRLIAVICLMPLMANLLA